MSSKTNSIIEYKKKLDKIEKDLLKLKKEGNLGMSKSTISLKGILKGITITEEEIEEAKKSLFKEVEI